MYDIIGKKYLFLGLSALLLIASITAMGMYGFKEGIDFVGGTSWQVRMAKKPTAEAVSAMLMKEFNLQEAIAIEEPTTQSVILRLPELNEDMHAKYRTALEKDFGAVEELDYETIGPAIGNELRGKATWAFLAVLLTISLYIAFAFRHVSRPISSWKYGFVTLGTLFHDAVIPLGLMAYLGHTYGVEINTNIVVAILVIIGFSVHDTIVVFDRIRENLRIEKASSFSFDALVNRSMNQTMIRSINTSLTLVLTLAALLLFGSANLFYFVLTILVGVVVGTYSSIFIASPLLTLWNKRRA
ncbi:MAG: protein translocase subunit SecF [Candidatus Pacebacteria bacterium]|nr:protein translocase subunit SecF [Candidatus Paceibacterota bacterium]